MTGSVQRAELTPAELDLLEDALADLEGLTPERDDLPPHLRARLGEYQSILALTREALPMVDVPGGILDAVIAEAQRSPAVQAETPRPPSLWERLRRSFVLPGFALAATAALLVLVLRPGDDPADLEEPPAIAPAEAEPTAPAEAALKDMSEAPALPAAAAPSAAGDDEGKRLDAAAEAELPAEEEADVAPERSVTPPPGSVASDKATSRSKKEKAAPAKKPSASKSAGGLGDGLLDDAKASKSEPAIDVGDKDALRSLLSAADKARYGGRCSDASGKYQQLRGVGGMEEARALVGLGLCAEASGDPGKAGEYFKQARSLAPAIDSVIASERQKMGVSSKKSKVDYE